ncbi:MAG: protein-glutamate O-methyltransferase CheR [Clostridia bacterium]|nr:protein-glutamate O-methyltransferase CheR [Clostridia bacterium]
MDRFDDYELFKTKFFNLSFIDLNLYKEKQMKRRITSLVEKYGFTTYCAFLEEIKVNKELYNTFINYLTINVSEFYRNPNQWDLFEKKIIPEIAKHKNNLSEVKIWSSACSTGDEPYTVVMILNKFLPLEKISILATDIDNEAMLKAKTGIYPSRSLKELPKEYLDKHFTKISDDVYQLSEKVRKCVQFKQLNLLREPYPKGMDIILCRNVLIYFTEEAKDYIFMEFSKSLAKNGVLFIGSTEQIMNYQKFEFKPIDTFFYQKI